jgi:hypothetical protein
MCYTPNDIDPYYYCNDEETGDPRHGYWLRSSDWELMEKYEKDCHEAVGRGIACWIDENNLYPF